ncbi:MAG: hypothetical protein M1834_008738 [Cirrosporium novae-zelandiae]|nr:MAG: hypothetical protein M1834_008738 [Cirrosporium novae-zelandiae]
MSVVLPRRPWLGLPFLAPSWSTSIPQVIARRHQSSFRRTQKRLRVKPDDSFLLNPSSVQDHIVFNPPSSVPSVYHTPLKFLPINDRRRQLYVQAAAREGADSIKDSRLPPAVHKPYEKRYHLKKEDLAEIRRLRTEDPVKWGVLALAKKFDCSTLLISMVCQAPKSHLDKQQEIVDLVKDKWGRRRREAREDRVRRREAWGRDA